MTFEAFGPDETWEGQSGDFSLGGLWLLLAYGALGAIGIFIKLHAVTSQPSAGANVRPAPEIGRNVFPELSPEFAPSNSLDTACAPIIKESVSAPTMPAPIVLAVPSAVVSSVAPLSLEDAMAFTDKSYYGERWQPMIDRSSNFGGFNLCAFLFGIAWCFYRKCYLLGIIVILAESLIALSVVLLFAIIAGFFFQQEPTAATFTFIAFVGALSLVRIPLGFWANRVLYNRAVQAVRSVDQLDVDQATRKEVIRSKGGVSKLGLLTALFIHLATLLASS